MRVVIEFTEPIHRTARGYLAGAIGGVFPYDIVEEVAGECSLALKQPTSLAFEDEVVVLTWNVPELMIGVSVHASRISELTLQFP